MEVIRAYMLEVGDKFIKHGLEYHVYKITDRICYRSLTGAFHTFGLSSQERIELITKHDKDGNEKNMGDAELEHV